MGRRRNIKNADIKLSEYQGTLVVSDIKELKYLNDQPLDVEIGMGKGKFIIEMAKRNPEINYLGIEKYDSVLLQACKKLDEKLPNLYFMCADATNIDSLLDGLVVNEIYLNFSDPWPKARHEKRRLTSPEFIKKYQKIAKQPLIINFKTDNRGLFEYTLQVFNTLKFNFEELSLDLHQDCPDVITTEYEDRFAQKGNPIYYVRGILWKHTLVQPIL